MIAWFFCTLAATLTVAVCASLSRSNSETQFTIFAASCLVQLALIAWIVLSKHFEKLAIKHVVCTALVLSAVGMFSSPLLEDDHFRYLWDGYITATTGRPYQHPPNFYFGDSSVPIALQEVLNGINYPEITTIYGPLLQLVFAASYYVAAGQLWPLKAILATTLVIVIVKLYREGVHPKWLLAFCIHPLLIKESILSAHPDLLIGALVMMAVIFWRKVCNQSAVIAICLAAAIKINIAVLLPVFCFTKRGRFDWTLVAISTVVLVTLHLPLVLEQNLGSFGGASTFAKQWVFNPLLFRAIVFLTDSNQARLIVLLLFGAICIAVFVKQYFDQQLHVNIFIAMIALLFLAPAVNPWYWLWLAPLSFFVSSPVVWAGATTSMLAYVHVLNPNSFIVPAWVGAIQVFALTAATILQVNNSRRKTR